MRKPTRRKLKKSVGLPKDLDVILDAIDAIHDDVLITDGEGNVIKVSQTFESLYGIEKDSALGRNVLDLEREGVFVPSITAMVLRTGEKVTLSQKNRNNRSIVVTAAPVFDEEGKITKVVSFSRDMTDYLNLQDQYSELEDKMIRYEEELDKLRSENIDIEGVISKDEKSQDILRTIRRIAPYDTNVLLTGESGVGKSMFAKVIHKNSSRGDGPFIEINCGAIPENLLESELFGYERGSFTGAHKDGKIGLIELAEGGTLFLDEISELSKNLQVKILKVIQDKTLTRVGGIAEISVDFRLITATNKNLASMMETGDFREDLYYRLNVISLDVPPLRERKKDIIPMVSFFVDEVNKKHGLNKSVSQGVLKRLLNYSWPGNIRELENLVERILLTTEDQRIKEQDLPDYLSDDPVQNMFSGKVSEHLTLTKAVEALEKEYLEYAYRKYGTTVGTAKALGISQPTAVRKLNKYKIRY